jgi:hypothetical protein
VITKRENSVENCFKMKFVYSFDKFGFFVPLLLLIARGGDSGRRVGFGSDTIMTRHDYF